MKGTWRGTLAMVPLLLASAGCDEADVNPEAVRARVARGLGPAGSGEVLGRGLVAMHGPGGVRLSWRLLPWDGDGAGFHVERAWRPDGPFERLTPHPIADSTGFTDRGGRPGAWYRVVPVVAGSAGAPSRPAAAVTDGTFAVRLQSGRSIKRVVPGDIDGDGALDLVALTPSDGNDGRCVPPAQRHVEIEVALWAGGAWGALAPGGGRITHARLGTGYQPPCPRTRRHTMAAATDLDGDGDAEIVARHGPAGELAIYDWENGALVLRAHAPWLGAAPHRRHYMTVARLADVDGDGVADPFIVVQSGVSAPQRFVAYRYVRGDAALHVTHDATFRIPGGMGAQGLVAFDLDEDGLDELLPCGSLLEPTPDGRFRRVWDATGGIETTACFPADIHPNPGLEVFMTPKHGSGPALLVDRNGQVLQRWPLGRRGGWERGWCADMDERRPGLECFTMKFNKREGWSSAHVFQTSGAGPEITHTFRRPRVTRTTWAVDWSRGDGVKGLFAFCNVPGARGCGYYTGWMGDLVGDTREEVVIFNRPGEVRVHVNPAPIALRRVTLLADRGYRAALGRVGVGYNTNFMPAASNRLRDDIASANRPPIGWLDEVSPDGVAWGWTLDPDAPARAIDVHFYVLRRGGRIEFAGAARADRPRPDVNRVTGHPGDHGFEWTLPPRFRDGRTTHLLAYGLDPAGSPNPLLSGAPKPVDLR